MPRFLLSALSTCSTHLRTVLLSVGIATTTPVGIARAFEWDAPVNVHPQEQVDDLFPRVANGPDGLPWVFWLGLDTTEQDYEIYYSRWDGIRWAVPAKVNPPNQDSELPPQVSTSRDGGLWVLWTAANPALPGAYLGLTSHWNGGGWAEPDTIWREGARHNGWSVAAVSRTEAWFVRDGASRFGSSDIFIYHLHNGIFDPEFQFVQPDSDEVIPTLTIDGAGEPWAAWHQRSPAGVGGPIQYSRLVGGNWSPPQGLSAPTDPNAPKLTTDASGVPWIVTLADAPFWPAASEAWAIHWGGNGWDVPIRLSDPILPLFTVQYQLSVSDDPGTNPVAVWVSRYAFSTTRADLLSSRWTGERWTPAALAGSLADSAIVTWPDVARTGGTVWAAFNRGVGNQTFVQNVFSIRETTQATFSDSVEFSAESKRNGVQLRWSVGSKRDIVSFRIVRSGDTDHSVPATVVELPSNRSHAGNYLDRNLPGPGRYLYWIEFVVSPEETLTVGPRSVEFALSSSVGSIDWASLSSRTGTVTLGGQRGHGASRLVIFDVNGRRVRSLEVSGSASRSGGRFEVTWDGSTESGGLASVGVYFAQLIGQGGGYEARRKLILLR
jgi:hypothetical protein